jgi:hypothetical protein
MELISPQSTATKREPAKRAHGLRQRIPEDSPINSNEATGVRRYQAAHCNRLQRQLFILMLPKTRETFERIVMSPNIKILKMAQTKQRIKSKN